MSDHTSTFDPGTIDDDDLDEDPDGPARSVEDPDDDDGAAFRASVRHILEKIGEDPSREGLEKTPARVQRMYRELTRGYRVDPDGLINNALFDVAYSEMVLVRGIEFYSLCEHHLLPFYGTAAVAYIPDGRVIGLSKIPRIVDLFARRLQVQERMTRQIADFIEAAIHPCGVAVVLEGWHLCATMRGVKKAHAVMVTSALTGSFKQNEMTRKEFFDHIGRETLKVSI